jgi:glycosyltransferase involved in cell wall biosynthesis
VLVTSEREALLLKPLLPDSMIAVVANGVDIEAFQQVDRVQQLPERIIFTGSMDYYPNIDAVLYFARECWPLIRLQAPTATWEIVGKNPPPIVQDLAKLAGISVTGSVPAVKPYLAAATVAIAPLLIGSGTRLKILEALAMGKAVVSTSLGCEGLNVVSGEHLIVADQPEVFAQSIVDLLQNAEQRAALGSAGRALAETYSWQRSAADVVRAVEKITR